MNPVTERRKRKKSADEDGVDGKESGEVKERLEDTALPLHYISRNDRQYLY